MDKGNSWISLLLLGLLFGLNILDAFWTWVWLMTGIAEESNPLMAYAFELGSGQFILLKLLLVGLGSMLLWLRRDLKMAQRGIYVCLLSYTYVLFVHANILWRVL